MGFFTRSFVSLSRKPGKAILLLLITFVLGTVISGAIIVSLAVQNTDANVRANFPPIVTVEIDNNALSSHFNATGEWPDDSEEFNHEMLEEIALLPQVESYDFTLHAGLHSKELEPVVPEDPLEEPRMLGDYHPIGLVGMQHTDPIDITSGAIQIVQGRMFTQSELDNLSAVAVVSDSFAALNNLEIGSILDLIDIHWNTTSVRDTGWDDSFYKEENIGTQRTLNLEVVGIYTSLVDMTTGDQWADQWMETERENRIYVPNNFAREVQIWQSEHEMEMFPSEEWFQNKTPEDMIHYSNIFKLHDVSDIPAFRAAVEEITPSFYTALDASSESLDFAGALDSLNSLSRAILIIAVGASILILSLLITLFLRERKKEIGIYLALGDKKSKVVAQMIIEILVMALIAIVLSLVVGSLLSNGMAETMLRNDLIAAGANNGTSFGGPLDRMGVRINTSVEDIMASYDLSLSLVTIAVYFAVSVTTVLVATIVPMLYVLRLNPRKIMM